MCIVSLESNIGVHCVTGTNIGVHCVIGTSIGVHCAIGTSIGVHCVSRNILHLLHYVSGNISCILSVNFCR